eukprot:6442975-Karenia_brevis.AAC.1
MAIIPVADVITVELKLTIKHFLRKVAPDWQEVPVVGAATLLGVKVGPAAHDVFWDEVLQGWQDSAERILGSKMTSYMLAKAYNVFSFSKLTYLLQLCAFPEHAIGLQRYFIHKIFRVPPSSFRDVDIFSLNCTGVK